MIPKLKTIRPALRDALIFRGDISVTGSMVATFAKSIRFHWPYEFRDSYMRSTATDAYHFSHAFKQHFNDVNSYRLHSSFFDQLPELAKIAIPMGDSTYKIADLSQISENEDFCMPP